MPRKLLKSILVIYFRKSLEFQEMSESQALITYNESRTALIDAFIKLLSDIRDQSTKVAHWFPSDPTNIDCKCADVLTGVTITLADLSEIADLDVKIKKIQEIIKMMLEPESPFLSIFPVIDSIVYDFQNSSEDYLYKPFEMFLSQAVYCLFFPLCSQSPCVKIDLKQHRYSNFCYGAGNR